MLVPGRIEDSMGSTLVDQNVFFKETIDECYGLKIFNNLCTLRATFGADDRHQLKLMEENVSGCWAGRYEKLDKNTNATMSNPTK